jgi:hypothetical protein
MVANSGLTGAKHHLGIPRDNKSMRRHNNMEHHNSTTSITKTMGMALDRILEANVKIRIMVEDRPHKTNMGAVVP